MLVRMKEMASDTSIEHMVYTDRIWLQERRKRIKQLIEGIYDEVKVGKILDVAMGQWSLIKNLFPELYVVGVDFRCPSHPPDGFCTVNLKAKLPFKDNEFQLVFAGEII